MPTFLGKFKNLFFLLLCLFTLPSPKLWAQRSEVKEKRKQLFQVRGNWNADRMMVLSQTIDEKLAYLEMKRGDKVLSKALLPEEIKEGQEYALELISEKNEFHETILQIIMKTDKNFDLLRGGTVKLCFLTRSRVLPSDRVYRSFEATLSVAGRNSEGPELFYGSEKIQDLFLWARSTFSGEGRNGVADVFINSHSISLSLGPC